jgi:LytT family two-component system response regulator NatR
MLKIGLVDDQAYDLEKLNAVISQIDGIEIVFATQDSEVAYRYIKNSQVDLLIADIEMPKFSGYELADLIDSYALDTSVIFVTAHSGYAVHAFELSVFDYIMKPYNRERLIKSIQRFKKKKAGNEDDRGRLVIKQKSEIHFILKKDIIYIERTGRSTTIVTTNEVYETYHPLNELEEELVRRDFFRSHRSFIINIHYVKNFSIYAKNSYLITFYHTTNKAFITKKKMEEFQSRYF